jgi:hypothetical protein
VLNGNATRGAAVYLRGDRERNEVAATRLNMISR